MAVFLDVLLFLHMLGWAIVLGASLVGLKSGTLYPGAFHAALTALVTGLAMVFVAALWADTYRETLPNYSAWVAVKLAVAVAITALVWFAHRRPDKVGRTLLGAVAGLTVLDVAVATIWR